MATKQTTATKRLKVGDRVMLPASKRRGTVVEDRGNFAPDGSQIVAIHLDGRDEDDAFDVAAMFLERIDSE
jgi:hypothetical protein